MANKPKNIHLEKDTINPPQKAKPRNIIPTNILNPAGENLKLSENQISQPSKRTKQIFSDIFNSDKKKLIEKAKEDAKIIEADVQKVVEILIKKTSNAEKEVLADVQKAKTLLTTAENKLLKQAHKAKEEILSEKKQFLEKLSEKKENAERYEKHLAEAGHKIGKNVAKAKMLKMKKAKQVIQTLEQKITQTITNAEKQAEQIEKTILEELNHGKRKALNAEKDVMAAMQKGKENLAQIKIDIEKNMPKPKTHKEIKANHEQHLKNIRANKQKFKETIDEVKYTIAKIENKFGTVEEDFVKTLTRIKKDTLSAEKKILTSIPKMPKIKKIHILNVGTPQKEKTTKTQKAIQIKSKKTQSKNPLEVIREAIYSLLHKINKKPVYTIPLLPEKSTITTTYDSIYSELKQKKIVPVEYLAKKHSMSNKQILDLALNFEETGKIEIYYPIFGSPKLILKEQGELADESN